jgi:hypothetical protein
VKILWTFSGVNPGPVSRTENVSFPVASPDPDMATLTSTSPCLVNLTALPAMFRRICDPEANVNERGEGIFRHGFEVVRFSKAAQQKIPP